MGGLFLKKVLHGGKNFFGKFTGGCSSQGC